MNKFFKRLALLLAVLMIVSMMPVQLFADNSVIVEGQSNGTTQNKAVASYELNGQTISFEGKTIREVNTKMRVYWEVDDANGCSYNADKLPADGKGALTWTIYGTVGQGEYLNSGALILPALSGGYIYKDGTYQWKNITVVAGDENATIVSNDTFDVNHIYVSNGANATTTFTGITLDGSLYVVPNGTVTFDGCVFKGMLRVPSGNGVVKVANCQFVGDADEDSTGKKNEYPFFFQAGGTLEFIGNTIAADTYKRGLNVGGLTELNATIENNTIGAVTAGYSAIQLSGKVTEAQIKGNKISLDGTNAFTLHESLISANKVTKVTVEGNKITGNGYLIYDDAAANNKAFTSDNLTLAIGTNTVASTVYTTQGVKGSNKYGISETVATVVKDALTPTHVANVAKVNGVGYATLAEAIAAATPDANGVITYEISGKAEISGADQWISFVKNAEGVKAVKFVGMTADAEISITSSGSILGVQGVDVDVSFENLTLSHPNGAWVDDLANATNYFACMVRRDGHTVTYTNCTFPNGACNNQFGKTVFNDCKFTSTTGWSLWNTSTGTSELNNCSFTGKRGIKLYAEGLTSAAGSVTVKDTTFVLNDSEKAAIEITKPGSVALDNISVSGTTAGTIKKNLTDGYKSVEKVTVTATGTGISGTFNGTTESGVAKKEFNISGGTFTSEVSSDYLADGFELKKNIDGTYGVKTAGAVEVWTGFSGPKVASYETIAEAVANLGKNNWIVITKDYTLTEDFVIPKDVYLDIEKGATLTVADGVTLTVAADCKRLGVRTDATLINNGTVLVCGTSPYDGGKVVAFAGSTVDIDKLTVPTGYFLDNNAASYFASIAVFKITYSDGSTKPASANTSWKNAVKVTLLTNVADFGGNNSVVAKNFVLDLGGFTLSGKTTASSEVLSISVPMTITNGTIKYVSSNTGSGALKTSADVTIDSTATIDGGVGYAIWTDGYDGHTLTVNGTVKSDGSYAITSNGSENGGRIAECNIIVNSGAVISAPNGIGIYHPELGTVTVNGGEITAHTGIEMCAGKLVVKGGKITSTGDNRDATGSQNAILDGAAVSIINRNYPGGIPTAEISGGEFKATGKDAQTIKAYDYKNNTVAEWTNVGESVSVSGGTFSSIPANMDKLCAEGFIPTKNADGTYGVKEATKGSEKNPYTLKDLSEMTRAEYIAAQEALGGTMYVKISDYSYGTNGVLGNGVRNDTPGQMPDHSKLNAYAENGYLSAKNDGANGKNIIFVGGSITSGVEGYTSIDNIGTSLLLAVPAYTNVTFEGVTFKNVISFDYQLYTSPWSQLGELKFSGCTFNGLIVGAIAAQTLTFNGCEFKNYTNTTEANNSNPTWIRPAYGNWSKGDNEGQGSDFKSLTTINFTNNTVTSTRPVKFERIAQWEMETKVTVTGNKFDIKSDGSSKNVGLYFGANAKFDLVVDNNKKTDGTAALYTAVYKAPNGTDYAGLPAGSTVKDSNGADVEVAGVIWKTTDALTLKTTTEAVEVAGVKFATLEEAFAAAKNGDTITLLEDCKSDRINLEDKSVTVVLNGKTLTSTAAYGVMFCAKNGNKITIDGTVEGSKLVGTLMITSGTDGHIEVNGGTYESNQYCPIYVNGSVSSENSTVTVKNAIIQAINSNSDQDSGCAVYLAGYSTSVFENCTITAPITGIEIRAGKLTLNNCDVTGGNGEVTKDANGNGTTVTNAALAISQHTTKKPIEVIINGGTFNGKAAVYQTDVQGTGSADVKIAVNDGTFNGTISGETDGTITISGGKFKVKVDDKYFANGHVCSGNPGADGYYTIADHPITNMGLSIGEGLSLRIYLLDGVTTGKLRVTYTKPDGEEVSYIIDETEFELVGNEESGYTEKYFFRIFNITPQMADMTITVQYIGEDGKDFGSAKEVSILKYCEGYIAKYPTENVKTFVSKLLEYCASAMDYVAIKYSEQVYNGKTWTERATALRAEKERLCGTDVPTFDFKELGTNSKFGRKIFDTNGIIFGESLTFYLGIRKENYNPDYHYIPTGSNETKPVFDEKSGEYRFYFTMAPYEYNTSMRIVVKSGNSTICERATSLDFLLNKYSAGDSAAARFCKAAYEYCRALEAVIKDINK